MESELNDVRLTVMVAHSDAVAIDVWRNEKCGISRRGNSATYREGAGADTGDLKMLRCRPEAGRTTTAQLTYRPDMHPAKAKVFRAFADGLLPTGCHFGITTSERQRWRDTYNDAGKAKASLDR